MSSRLNHVLQLQKLSHHATVALDTNVGTRRDACYPLSDNVLPVVIFHLPLSLSHLCPILIVELHRPRGRRPSASPQRRMSFPPKARQLAVLLRIYDAGSKSTRAVCATVSTHYSTWPRRFWHASVDRRSAETETGASHCHQTATVERGKRG